MKSLHILVTAGPTHEPIDPVRYLSNHSTGAMGYAVAAEAKRRRHRVTLISGPTPLSPPTGLGVTRVVTAAEMRQAVLKAWPRMDALVMAAAVSDFTPRRPLVTKQRRQRRWALELIGTPDILGAVRARRSPGQALVGFALESERLLERARQKLRQKRLDLIVANVVSPDVNPFGERPTTVWLIPRSGPACRLAQVSKRQVARAILDFVEKCAVVQS